MKLFFLTLVLGILCLDLTSATARTLSEYRAQQKAQDQAIQIFKQLEASSISGNQSIDKLKDIRSEFEKALKQCQSTGIQTTSGQVCISIPQNRIDSAYSKIQERITIQENKTANANQEIKNQTAEVISIMSSNQGRYTYIKCEDGRGLLAIKDDSSEQGLLISKFSGKQASDLANFASKDPYARYNENCTNLDFQNNSEISRLIGNAPTPTGCVSVIKELNVKYQQCLPKKDFVERVSCVENASTAGAPINSLCNDEIAKLRAEYWKKEHALYKNTTVDRSAFGKPDPCAGIKISNASFSKDCTADSELSVIEKGTSPYSDIRKNLKCSVKFTDGKDEKQFYFHVPSSPSYDDVGLSWQCNGIQNSAQANLPENCSISINFAGSKEQFSHRLRCECTKKGCIKGRDYFHRFEQLPTPRDQTEAEGRS